LFAAIGGFGHAFQQVGADLLWANEKDKNAVETFRANFDESVRSIHKPIEELNVKDDGLEPVDILTAGFPCQPFSIAGGARGFDDDRGLLFLHIIRLLKEFGNRRPKVLLLENVGNFKSHDRGRTFKRVQSEIQRAGYWFGEKNVAMLNTASHTRIPQNRNRIFMIAVDSAVFQANTIEFPEPLPEGSLDDVWDYLDHRKKQDSWFYFTPESQYYDLFCEAIEEHGRKKVYLLRRNYVRANMANQCFTLMANMGVGGHNEPVIKDRWGIRKLTPRECARLQGYEDEWFVIPESVPRRQVYKQIGNSVTVPLVKLLAERCFEFIADSANYSATKARQRA
jgi:DNA (cytosine-5)-methyltransferase 1